MLSSGGGNEGNKQRDILAGAIIGKADMNVHMSNGAIISYVGPTTKVALFP
jgi:hypothetical protein